MKPILERLVDEQTEDRLKRSTAREYLQARILQALQDQGLFSRWTFHGGTALRFLYGLPRYSEDLDFSLTPDTGSLNFDRSITQVCNDLAKETYDVDMTMRSSGAVYASFIRFRDLYDLLWYLSDPDWPAPNLRFLNNAQTIGDLLTAH